MKAFSPVSFEKIAGQTGIDVEIVSAAAAAVQHDIATNRDKSTGPYLHRLRAAVKIGFGTRPSLLNKSRTLTQPSAWTFQRLRSVLV